MKDEKTLDFWESCFATKVPKEKFDKLCSDSSKRPESEAILTSDLLEFINNSTYDIGDTNFDSLDKIRIPRICNSEVHKSLPYDHTNSKGHREKEKYLDMKRVTNCDRCRREIKNDEWRQHIISSEHLLRIGEKKCDICKRIYVIIKYKKESNESKRHQLKSNIH